MVEFIAMDSLRQYPVCAMHGFRHRNALVKMQPKLWEWDIYAAKYYVGIRMMHAVENEMSYTKRLHQAKALCTSVLYNGTLPIDTVSTAQLRSPR